MYSKNDKRMMLGCSVMGLILMLFLCYLEGDEFGDQNQEYCEMVSLYKQSNGQHGWPDYKQQWEMCE